MRCASPLKFMTEDSSRRGKATTNRLAEPIESYAIITLKDRLIKGKIEDPRKRKSNTDGDSARRRITRTSEKGRAQPERGMTGEPGDITANNAGSDSRDARRTGAAALL